MNCLQAREFFSPYMDDMLEAGERELLARHLEECRVCRNEMRAWEKVSRSLGGLADHPREVPPSLCANVMAEIRRTDRRRPAAAWRKAVAAAAAVLLLAGGPSLVNNGMKLFNNRPAVVAKNPTGSPVPPDNTGGEKIADTTPSGGPGLESRDPVAPESGGQNQPGPKTVPTGSTITSPESTAVKESKADVYRVLLNTKLETTSTLLKIRIESPDAVASALAAAKAAGASTQVLENQNVDGRQVSIARMVAPGDKALGLIGQLSAMGRVIKKEDETRDITGRYNETLLQYEEMVERGDPGAQSLEKQLESWKKELGSHIVVLWMERG